MRLVAHLARVVTVLASVAACSAATEGHAAAQGVPGPATQRVSGEPPPILRITTEIIQFDATVVYQHRALVTTLGPEDFVVLQDGVAVDLKDVIFVDRRATGVGRWVDVPAQPSAPAEADHVPVVGIDVEPLIVLVDDMAMTPDGFARLKAGLRAFILDGVPPRVEIGLLRTGQRGKRTTALMADPAELLARIDSMQYLVRSYHGTLASESGASEPGTRALERTFSQARSAA